MQTFKAVSSAFVASDLVIRFLDLAGLYTPGAQLAAPLQHGTDNGD
jgi:hypothetical protein